MNRILIRHLVIIIIPKSLFNITLIKRALHIGISLLAIKITSIFFRRTLLVFLLHHIIILNIKNRLLFFLIYLINNNDFGWVIVTIILAELQTILQ